ncbi:MAG: nuclear transport factor 2 family protein [bacterium]
MKTLVLLCCVFIIGCTAKKTEPPIRSTAQEESAITDLVNFFYDGMKKAYTGQSVNTDSLLEYYFEPDIYYITPWGWSEPLDSTKARLRNARSHITDYDIRIENLTVRSFGDGGYAFFILQQNSTIDGVLLEEYLPTTFVVQRKGDRWKIIHCHRSTDYETFQQYIQLQKHPEAKKPSK